MARKGGGGAREIQREAFLVRICTKFFLINWRWHWVVDAAQLEGVFGFRLFTIGGRRWFVFLGGFRGRRRGARADADAGADAHIRTHARARARGRAHQNTCAGKFAAGRPGRARLPPPHTRRAPHGARAGGGGASARPRTCPWGFARAPPLCPFFPPPPRRPERERERARARARARCFSRRVCGAARAQVTVGSFPGAVLGRLRSRAGQRRGGARAPPRGACRRGRQGDGGKNSVRQRPFHFKQRRPGRRRSSGAGAERRRARRRRRRGAQHPPPV